IGPFEFPYETP
uniref:Uncharacterized protein n=1 Tax=Acrobeloides nanus TaxID=290746 RepID=A0A914CSF4_9BILA